MNQSEFMSAVEFYDGLDEVIGTIRDLDLVNGTITIDGNEYDLMEPAKDQALRRLGLNGTVSDFTRSNGKLDVEFVQRAVKRKIYDWGVRPSKILTDGVHAYSVMSARYERIPHSNVINEASRYVDIDRYFDPQRSFVSPKNMYLYLKGVDEFEVPDDSDYLFGAMIKNSETGWGAIGISQFVERLVCSNGLTSRLATMSVAYAHSGRAAEFYRRNLRDMLKPDTIIEIITAAVNGPQVVKDLDNLPRYLSKFRIKKAHWDGIIEAWKQESNLGLTQHGISNAITRYNDHVYRNSQQYDPDEYFAMANAAMEILYI